MKTFIWLIYILLLASSISNSLIAVAATHQEKDWGVGLIYRSAQSPYVTDDDQLSTLMPVMYYKGEHLFMRGLDGGAHIYKDDTWQLNLITRMRFIDIPKEYREKRLKGYNFDGGIQLRKNFTHSSLDIEVMSDMSGNFFGNLSNNWQFNYDHWQLLPSINLRYKTADFNSEYFSLYPTTQERISGGIELSAKVETRYQVTSNLYLLGSLSTTRLDNQAYQSQLINSQWNNEVHLGFGFFNDGATPRKDSISTKPYFRVAYGWATPSNIGEILTGKNEKDIHNNTLSSIFYGHPLTDSFFNMPVDVYLTPGLIWHHSSNVQASTAEGVIAFKVYYTFDFLAKIRLGIAEGISYIADISYIEQEEMDMKGYDGSKFLNYLDFSLDINLGDTFNSKALADTWFGYSMHHRSAIYEKSSQFGDIKGGSNYNTIYLQFDF